MWGKVQRHILLEEDTLSEQRAIRLLAAKIDAGGVIVLGGRQPTFVLFLASTGFILPAGPEEFFILLSH